MKVFQQGRRQQHARTVSPRPSPTPDADGLSPKGVSWVSIVAMLSSAAEEEFSQWGSGWSARLEEMSRLPNTAKRKPFKKNPQRTPSRPSKENIRPGNPPEKWGEILSTLEKLPGLMRRVTDKCSSILQFVFDWPLLNRENLRFLGLQIIPVAARVPPGPKTDPSPSNFRWNEIQDKQ